jgi:outer membrane protein assembly factor BamB
MRRIVSFLLVIVGLASASCESPPGKCTASWLQWGRDSMHSGQVCEVGQTLTRTIDHVTYDPFVAVEQADASGDLLAHYQVPLVVGGDVYMEYKGGTYTPCTPAMPPDMPYEVCPPYQWNSETWGEKAFAWSSNGKLVEKWMFDTDWKPEPMQGNFEPMFQPVITGDTLWLPGGGGSVYMVDRKTGKQKKRVQPFGQTIDPDTYVAGALAADAGGNVYYSALKLNHDKPWSSDALGWLVAVAPDGSYRTVSYTTLVPGAPKASDQCERNFYYLSPPVDFPWPPIDPATGGLIPVPTGPCGSQRPTINAAPAIGPDGTIFVVSRAHRSARYGYVVAVSPELKPLWQTSLRGILNDGCGVLVPSDGDPMDRPYDCTPGAKKGVDPLTGNQPAALADDASSSSPVALPDGGVLYGALTGYNGSRGHLIKFDQSGKPGPTYDFGWDSTPALWQHDGTYSIVIKDNHYGTDSNGVDLGPYYITQLDAELNVEWKFKSTNTMSCDRDPSNNLISCVPDHPNGFEWCINAPVVDKDGTVFVNSEDGNIYSIAQGGHEKQHLFLDMSVGAAYTPLAIDENGLIYTLNDGNLTVTGR